MQVGVGEEVVEVAEHRRRCGTAGGTLVKMASLPLEQRPGEARVVAEEDRVDRQQQVRGEVGDGDDGDAERGGDGRQRLGDAPAALADDVQERGERRAGEDVRGGNIIAMRRSAGSWLRIAGRIAMPQQATQQEGAPVVELAERDTRGRRTGPASGRRS